MDVVQVASANEASALIRAECYKILNELANYNYDPAVYQRRVRDREGWSDVIVAADEAGRLKNPPRNFNAAIAPAIRNFKPPGRSDGGRMGR